MNKENSEWYKKAEKELEENYGGYLAIGDGFSNAFEDLNEAIKEAGGAIVKGFYIEEIVKLINKVILLKFLC